MTPQEAVAAYEAYCATTKGFQLQWKESGMIKVAQATTSAGAVTKFEEVIAIADQDSAVTSNRIDLIPTWGGFLDWLAIQP